MHGRGNCTPGAEPGQRISPLHEAKGQTRVENPLVRGGGDKVSWARKASKRTHCICPIGEDPRLSWIPWN